MVGGKKILEGTTVLIGTIYFLEGLCKFTKPCDVTL